MTVTPDQPATAATGPATVVPSGVEPIGAEQGSRGAEGSIEPDRAAAETSVEEPAAGEITTPDAVAVPEQAPESASEPESESVSESELRPEPEPEAESGQEPQPAPEVEPEPEPEAEPNVLGADDLQAAVAAVREAVRAGECVVLPTDTVYGIGADAFSADAVQRLLDAKQRGRDMPPPVLIADAVMLDTLVDTVPTAARALAQAHWPGPLTLILKAHSNLRMDLGETGGTLAVRVPDHEVARAILRATGPLAVSSANLSGRDAATDVSEAASQLRATVAVYVDAGPTPGAVPSTIVDFSASEDGRIVRAGVLAYDDLLPTAPALVDGTAPEPEPPQSELPEGSTEAGTAEPGVTEPSAEESATEAGTLEASEAAVTEPAEGGIGPAEPADPVAAAPPTSAEEPSPPALEDLLPPPVAEVLPGAPPLIPDLDPAAIPDETPT